MQSSKCKFHTLLPHPYTGRADEGNPWNAIAESHAETGGLAGWHGVGRYTDDTQMTLALAQSLVSTKNSQPHRRLQQMALQLVQSLVRTAFLPFRMCCYTDHTQMALAPALEAGE